MEYEIMSMRRNKGVVYICGAGPGDPNLITVRCLELLKSCDIVLYDRLVGEEIISQIPVCIEKVYVGKSVGCSGQQGHINKIMIEYARQGKKVLRLKGGDPFIFGRGGEEAEFLQSKKIRFEIIPGISSAIASPAYAGVPLTHRKYSSSVAITTGHEDPEKGLARINWKGLAKAVDTIVVLMGMERLPQIIGKLRDGGLSNKINVIVIEAGTTNKQRYVHGRLDDILIKVKKAKIHSPAVIVIGEVTALCKRLAWFSR
ncbi:MAG: uroporphyrinogen-III C-methyltransferase [Nitrososphaeraceae archaeon]|jgi:uroporphyrin-III C-methyltransferase